MVDSGSNVHVVFDKNDLSDSTDNSWRISQLDGGLYTTATGHLDINTLALDKHGNWCFCLLNSGAIDAGLTPLASKPLFSAQSVEAQGHANVEHGNSPGLYLHQSVVESTSVTFIPYVRDPMPGGFHYVPIFPKPADNLSFYLPSQTPIHVNLNEPVNSRSFARVIPYHASANAGELNSDCEPCDGALDDNVSDSSLAPNSGGDDAATDFDISEASPPASIRHGRGIPCLNNRINKSSKLIAELAKHGLDQQKFFRQLRDIERMHCILGHRDMSKVSQLKRHGKVVASKVPAKFLREFKRTCPICAATKRQKNRSPSNVPASVSATKPFEVVYADSSGKFKVASARNHRYFTVFVDDRTRRKVVITHKTRADLPIVLLQFVQRIGVWPSKFFVDKEGAWRHSGLQKLLLVKGSEMIKIPKNEHPSNGPAEVSVKELSKMLRAYLVDSHIPLAYWDYVVEHASLVHCMSTICPNDPSKTIFEAETGVTPNLDLLPRLGCMAVRPMSKSDRGDLKLGLLNEPGVFLGFSTVDGLTGAAILVEKSVVLADQQVAFCDEVMPFKDAGIPNNKRWSHLHRLLGELKDKTMSTLPIAQESSEAIATALPDDLFEDEVDDIASEAELKEIDSVLEQAIEISSSVPCFNPLKENDLPSTASTVGKGGTEVGSDIGSRRLRSDSAKDAEADLSLNPQPEVATEKMSSPRRGQLNGGQRIHSFDPEADVRKHKQPQFSVEEIIAEPHKLIGRKLKRFFPGFGGAIGSETAHNR